MPYRGRGCEAIAPIFSDMSFIFLIPSALVLHNQGDSQDRQPQRNIQSLQYLQALAVFFFVYEQLHQTWQWYSYSVIYFLPFNDWRLNCIS